ncbi:MAG: DUF1538 domain-containing protein [Dehalococcoidales bacterium]|nr:DUF1538 domain-containing protein [Dehalococcoidales bacterium]
MPNNIRARVLEVVMAILPLVLVVVVLQFALVKMPANLFLQFIIGAIMVIAGMILFLFGVEIGILPMGKALGSELPKRGSLSLVIGIAFLIGFTATIAEPDVIVLTRQVDAVSGGAIAENVLVYIIAIGVAFFVAMAILRILLNFPIAYLLAAGYIVIIILALFTPAEFVPVAFDSGGVTTGPMTVPIILALGLGFSSVLAGRSALSDGFGLIGLASIGPVIGVMIMGMVLS